MALRQTLLKQFVRWVGRGAVLLGFAAGVIVLMLWLAGRFSPKVPVTPAADQAQAPTINGQLVRVQLIRLLPLDFPHRDEHCPAAEFADAELRAGGGVSQRPAPIGPETLEELPDQLSHTVRINASPRISQEPRQPSPTVAASWPGKRCL
jgi:hypothetical protein